MLGLLNREISLFFLLREYFQYDKYMMIFMLWKIEKSLSNVNEQDSAFYICSFE